MRTALRPLSGCALLGRRRADALAVMPACAWTCRTRGSWRVLALSYRNVNDYTSELRVRRT